MTNRPAWLRSLRGFSRNVIGGERVDAIKIRRILFDEWIGDSFVREHARRLGQYKNRYSGKRCVILGNGPSLGKMDLSILRNEFTFGLNRGYLLFDKLGFETTFLVSVNDLVIQQCSTEMLATGCEKFLSIRNRDVLSSDRPDVTFLRFAPREAFCRNLPRDGVCEGGTVSNVAIQLAHFMGFTTVILIGLDHRFAAKGPPNKVVTSTGPDADHFDGSYFGSGFKWQLPDLQLSEESYIRARANFKLDGRVIVDATVDGALTVFPKVDLQEFLAADLSAGR